MLKGGYEHTNFLICLVFSGLRYLEYLEVQRPFSVHLLNKPIWYLEQLSQLRRALRKVLTNTSGATPNSVVKRQQIKTDTGFVPQPG